MIAKYGMTPIQMHIDIAPCTEFKIIVFEWFFCVLSSIKVYRLYSFTQTWNKYNVLIQNKSSSNHINQNLKIS